jgi:hypothetical protein
VIYLGLSLLPFFFFHFLDRYILGSMIPAALLCALAFKFADVDRLRLEFRLGMAVSSIVVFLWVGLSWWFKTSIWELGLVLGAYLFLAMVWLRRPKAIPLALSASVVWLALTGLLLPTFGSNKVPPAIVERVKNSRVILYRVPEPAFLPMMLRRSLEFKEELMRRDELDLRGKAALIFVNERDRKRFEQRAAALKIGVMLVDSYSGFPSTDGFTGQSRDKTIAGNMTRALRTRSLEPIMDTFLLYKTE